MNAKIWLCIAVCLTIVHAQKNSFLIVEKPEALKLFNVYRQEIADFEKRQLGNFVPFQLDQVITFADGVTQAYRAKVLNLLFYLLIDSEGQPVNLESAGFTRWEYRVHVLLDTVEIQPGYQLQLLNPETKKIIVNLSAGQLLVRIFRKNNFYYVGLLSNPVVYGQLKRPANRAWKKIKSTSVPLNRIFNKILKQVRFMVQDKNQVYKKLYQFYRKDQQNTGYPEWKVIQDGKAITLVFTRPDLLEKWPESTKIFFSEINSLAERNGFEVNVKNSFTWQISKRSRL